MSERVTESKPVRTRYPASYDARKTTNGCLYLIA
jgi:hypothetical protein